MEIPERGDCEGRCQGSGGGRAGRQAGALLEAPEPGLPAAGGRRGLVVDACEKKEDLEALTDSKFSAFRRFTKLIGLKDYMKCHVKKKDIRKSLDSIYPPMRIWKERNMHLLFAHFFRIYQTFHHLTLCARESGHIEAVFISSMLLKAKVGPLVNLTTYGLKFVQSLSFQHEESSRLLTLLVGIFFRYTMLRRNKQVRHGRQRLRSSR
ncbi:hypothetical protein OPV22_024857 [Ensete ventricosum]|uniref:Uncharacterized protein n=1 Tax=Ensete ventricosum TaxID=4639 RepID=A0AAV8QBB6_ENSVE|nr:hypothetical protein OPV22_024857 [Ensete ventricosum]